MKVASLFSGGKDSVYALWCTQMQGWDIEALVTVFSESKDSWMFHFPAVRWTRLQAEAI
jgi:diphthamide synthase (EF-2-diphthine--ammonia ligase)